jgi:hypothetical protein
MEVPEQLIEVLDPFDIVLAIFISQEIAVS